MDEYSIIVTNHALRAFADIRDYIAIELVNPSAAVNHMQLFRSEIKKLSENPSRFRLIDEQPWHDEGIRKVRVKNYYIYYMTAFLVPGISQRLLRQLWQYFS